jgi:MFS family permease
VRLFAYGGSTLILAAYLSEIGVSETRTGLFMTLTLAGDVFISFCLTLVADALGRRVILGLGAILMAASGVAFAFTDNYWALLAAAILGVITPRQGICTLAIMRQWILMLGQWQRDRSFQSRRRVRDCTSHG